jgi:PAS domain S-box-containing protein
MHALMRDFEWAASSLGLPQRWPAQLRTIADLLLDTAVPMCVGWGPELRSIYNDAFLPIAGQKHPAALGARMQDIFAEVWPDVGALVQRAQAGESCLAENLPAEIVRGGRPSRGWFTFSLTPVRDEHGGVAGITCIGAETTQQVLMEQRRLFQVRMSEHLRGLCEPVEIIENGSRLLGQQLHAARVGYLEVDEAQQIARVRHDWTDGKLRALAGESFVMEQFGPAAVAQLGIGQILQVDDVASDERTAAFAEAWDPIGAKSALAIPLVKGGRLREVLCAQCAAAHVWTVDEVLLAQDAAERIWSALEQAHEEQRRLAEQDLQRSSALQAFKLELSDSLRPLTDPDQIIATASGLLGRHLGLSRVLYAQVDDAKGTFEVGQDWVNEGVPSVAGRVSRLDDFGAGIIKALRAGETVAVDDIEQDERTAPNIRAYAHVGVRSFLVLPLLMAGRLSIALILHHARPFHWKQADIQRAREMVERTWAYVETARALAALRSERDQSRHVFDSMTEGFAMVAPDCTLLRINAEGLRMGELTAGEVIGRKVSEIWPKARGTGLGELYRQVAKTGKSASLEYQRTFDDQRVSWIEVRAFPSLDGGMAVFYRDINERKQAEEKLKQADRRKDEFLAMLAHELRNPLAPIAAAAQLLARAELSALDVKHTSEVIARQVGHMTRLVNDLMDMSRVKGGQIDVDKVSLDVNEIVPEAVEQIEVLLRERGHRLNVRLSATPARVLGDRTRLVQVLANLLNNAAKYTAPGGDIALRVDAQEDYVAIAVRDSGIGMSADLLESAFGLFVQGQRSPDRTAGLGIGLALVKAIVELHGGTTIAHSAGPGHGSEFLVLLPRDRASSQLGEKPVLDSLLAPTGLRELNILIVDDNVDAARMLALLMKVAGHRAVVAHEPQYALQLAQSTPPDVCLLDIGLPGMNGNELARHLRANPATSGAVLIAVTGYGQEPQRPDLVGREFNHHLVKPIETGRLLALLRQVGLH